MEFYQKALGGTLTLTTYKEVSDSTAPEDPEQIAYAELTSDHMILKGMDSKIANPEARKVELMVSGGKDDEETLRKIFAALAEGGKAKQAMEQHPRGNMQGRLYDVYGIDWIVSVES